MKFRCVSPPGPGKATKYHHRNCPPPLAQFVHPMCGAKVSARTQTPCFTDRNEPRVSYSPYFSWGHLNRNSSAEAKGGRSWCRDPVGSRETQTSSRKGELPSRRRPKAMPSPFPWLCRGVCVIGTLTALIAPNSWKCSCYLQNFPEALAATQRRMFRDGSPRGVG